LTKSSREHPTPARMSRAPFGWLAPSFHFQYTAHRGLASSPRSCRIMLAEAGTHGDGRGEMRVLSSTYGSHGNVEPMVGVAVRLRALCAPAAGGVMPAGVRR